MTDTITSAQNPKVLVDISIDNVIFGFKQGRLKVLLVRYKTDEGRWSLPGGYVLENEDIKDAAGRLLRALSGIENLFLEQFKAFGQVDRVPHQRVVTVAYFALISLDEYKIETGELIEDVAWFDLTPARDSSALESPVPNLVYDHNEILDVAQQHLKHKVRHEPIGFNLLPMKFTLLQLQELYEAILGVKLDKPNFRRKMAKMKLLLPLGEKQQNVAHRAAELYRFDTTIYDQLKNQGFVFEV